MQLTFHPDEEEPESDAKMLRGMDSGANPVPVHGDVFREHSHLTTDGFDENMPPVEQVERNTMH